MLQTFEEEEENVQDLITKANLPKRGIILDIRTGMGWMAASMAKIGYGVISYLTLHHTADIESTIEKMVELCKKGGRILIVELTMAQMERYMTLMSDINELYEIAP